MIVDLFVLVVVLGLAAWLVVKVSDIERATSGARRRIKLAKLGQTRLTGQIEKLKGDQERLTAEIAELDAELPSLRTAHATAQQVLEHLTAQKRPRLIVLQDRRNAGDREWVVTIANPSLAQIDSSHPLLKDWLDGRAFLVFAKGEAEARERAIRRFSGRPGFTVTAVAPLAEGIFPAPSETK